MGRPIIDAADIVAEISETQGRPRAAVGMIFNAIRDSIIAHVCAGQRVRIVGLGQFYLRRLPERVAWCPQAKRRIKFPKTVWPHFRAGEKFREAVREKR